MSGLQSCLDKFADKDKRIYQEYYTNGKEIIEKANPWITYDIIQDIQRTIQSNPVKGQKEYAYKLLNVYSQSM